MMKDKYISSKIDLMTTKTIIANTYGTLKMYQALCYVDMVERNDLI